MSTSSQVPFTSILSSSFLAIILWLIGFVMAGIGGHELLTALRCGDEPAPITVAELAHRGPTQGDYVTLTDFDINWDGYVYWQDEHGNWTTCDVPLWAAGSEAPPRVLVRAAGARSEADLHTMLNSAELSGIVTGRGLHGEYAAALAAFNPGIDPAACWIVHLNKQPASAAMLGGIVLAGFALFTLANFLLVYVRQPTSPTQVTLRMMSPLIMVVDGLHALSDRLPAGSRRTCGLVLSPVCLAAVAWSGYRLWQLANVSSGDAGFGGDILPIFALLFGGCFALIGLSFLLVQPPGRAQAAPALMPQTPLQRGSVPSR
jgi:hypothetical protein